MELITIGMNPELTDTSTYFTVKSMTFPLAPFVMNGIRKERAVLGATAAIGRYLRIDGLDAEPGKNNTFS